MSDKEEFVSLKEHDIQENEKQHGEELKDLYGKVEVNHSYINYRKLSNLEYNESKRIGKEVLNKIPLALKTNNTQGILAKELCDLHREWIKYYWTNTQKKSI